MCSPIAESPTVAPPVAVAVLGASCNPVAESEDCPDADAVLGAVCRPIASSPAVAEPLPDAERLLLWSVVLLEEPAPLPLAVLMFV
jgi:hypothetical protein